MENLLFLGVPILKHIRVLCILFLCLSLNSVEDIHMASFIASFDSQF